MSLFNMLGMSPEKAISMIVSGNGEKIEKGRAWIFENADTAYPALVEKFAAESAKDFGKKGQPPALKELYEFICGLELLTEDAVSFVSAYLKRPESVVLDDIIPENLCEKGYQSILTAIHDNRAFVRERAFRLMEKITLPEQILFDLTPMIAKGSENADDAMNLLKNVDGDLMPVREALYKMLDVYPNGDTAARTIISLSDRLPCDANAMRVLLNDDGTRTQKRAVSVALEFARENDEIFDILFQAVVNGEGARTCLIDAVEKKDELSEKEMDLTWEALTHASYEFTVSRAIRILTAQGKPALSLFLYHIRNSDSASAVYALRCLTAMKEDTSEVDRLVMADLADDGKNILSKIDIKDYAYLGSYLRQNGDDLKELVASKARIRCMDAGVPVPPEILSSLSDKELADTVEKTLNRIFAVYGRGYDEAFAEKFLEGLDDILQIDRSMLMLAVKAAGYVFAHDGYTDETRLTNNDANAAVNRLRSINTPASSNILHLISKKKDIAVTLCPVGESPESAEGAVIKTISFEQQRQNANAELERRGFPYYDARNYLI